MSTDPRFLLVVIALIFAVAGLAFTKYPVLTPVAVILLAVAMLIGT